MKIIIIQILTLIAMAAALSGCNPALIKQESAIEWMQRHQARDDIP